MKTIEELFKEVVASKDLTNKLVQAVKNKRLEAFMKEHGCNATKENAIEFGKAKLAAGELPLPEELIEKLLWA